jgi:NTE family protein
MGWGLVARSFSTQLALLLVAWIATGCAGFQASNARLAHWDPTYGYRPPRVFEKRPPGKVLVILAFSGGGTRAAALSYGVLQELRDTQVAVAGKDERLLDEVDVITAVSGGSFTAAYYGLFGDRIFQDFETRFLRRNIQGRLLLGLLNPLNWFRFAATFFSRTDLAVQYYDETIFDHSTFADLLAAKGPLLQINATDLEAGTYFTFFQPQFDLLCSDLSSFPVARAAAASSAVPGLFSSIVLRNYSGSCGFVQPPWLEQGLEDRKTDPRRFRRAKIVEGYLDAEKRPYVHLLDGGIADNLGLRVPLENVHLVGGPLARLEQLDTPFDRVVVIVVNAEVHPPATFGLAAAAPGIAAVLGSVADTQIYAYNFETIELMRESLEDWARELPPASDGGPVRTSLITLGFESIGDPTEREFFESVSTSFSLPDTTVTRLIAVARQLLRESPEYQALLQDLKPASG